MEITVTEEKGNRFEFEIDETAGFLNALKKELLNDDSVKVATYYVKHPLTGNPKFIVEAPDARKAIAAAAARLKKLNAKFLETAKKEIK